MSLREIYERGVDEDDGQTISATECPECAGTLDIDDGEIACLECGVMVNE